MEMGLNVFCWLVFVLVSRLFEVRVGWCWLLLGAKRGFVLMTPVNQFGGRGAFVFASHMDRVLRAIEWPDRGSTLGHGLKMIWSRFIQRLDAGGERWLWSVKWGGASLGLVSIGVGTVKLSSEYGCRCCCLMR